MFAAPPPALVAAEQTAEEVDDPVISVAHLAHDRADGDERGDDDRAPQAQPQDEDGDDEAREGPIAVCGWEVPRSARPRNRYPR